VEESKEAVKVLKNERIYLAAGTIIGRRHVYLTSPDEGKIQLYFSPRVVRLSNGRWELSTDKEPKE
jgi:hypothetical protein